MATMITNPRGAFLRSRVVGVAAIVGLALVGASVPMSVSAATYQDCSASTPNAAGTTPCLFNNWEMDGDTAVNGGGNDWAANPYPTETFTDATPDISFKTGSKYLDQPNWTCEQHPVTPKDDITTGALSLATLANQHQVLFFNFNRVSGKGDTFIDFVISKGSPPASATCFTLPARAVGDVVVTLTLTNGGSTIGLLLNRWNGTGFDVIPNPPLGSGYQVALSADGTFGEGGLDATAAGFSSLSCESNANAYMDSRSSGSGAPSEMKDFISGGAVAQCETKAPNSSITKAERDVTTGGSFSAGPITAHPGDVIEYQLGYVNSGNGVATAVTVNDVVPTDHGAYVANSCTPACTYTAGTHTLLWDLGDVAAGGSRTMTFQLQLDATFPVGTTTISNVGVASSAEEGTKTSNRVDATVTVAPPPPSPSPSPAAAAAAANVNLPVAGSGAQVSLGLLVFALVGMVLLGVAARRSNKVRP